MNKLTTEHFKKHENQGGPRIQEGNPGFWTKMPIFNIDCDPRKSTFQLCLNGLMLEAAEKDGLALQH